jgi:DNA-binding NtrC family response regulator
MSSILIVEDENSLRQTLTRYLTREGHDVISVGDGREAFDKGLAACPEILVTDWMLKNHIHGLHVAEALKAVNPSLHTILITGFPSQDLLSESDRCGVLQLLEKPFDLRELQDAVLRAGETKETAGRVQPIAVATVDNDGEFEFVSQRASEFFARTPAGGTPARLQEVMGPDCLYEIESASKDWIPHLPTLAEGNGEAPERWLVRARQTGDASGWLLVFIPEDEQARTADPRVRILLDHRSRPKPILADHGPVVVIERDGAVRRLLVSQMERIGTLCYPAEDLASALKLIEAEPRVANVLLDFGLAGSEVEAWVEAIRGVRPDILIIGTGGSGSEEDLLALGVARVLPKPWRIMDLLDAMTH